MQIEHSEFGVADSDAFSAAAGQSASGVIDAAADVDKEAVNEYGSGLSS